MFNNIDYGHVLVSFLINIKYVFPFQPLFNRWELAPMSSFVILNNAFVPFVSLKAHYVKVEPMSEILLLYSIQFIR